MVKKDVGTNDMNYSFKCIDITVWVGTTHRPFPFGFWVRKFVLCIRIPCGSHDDILLPPSFGAFQHLWQRWIQPLNNISFVLLDTCWQSINPMHDAALLDFLIYLLLLKIRISLCVLIVPVNHHSTDIQECQGNCCQQFLHLYKKGYKMGFNLKVIRLACWLVFLFSFYFRLHVNKISDACPSSLWYLIQFFTSFNRLLLLVAWQQLWIPHHLHHKLKKCFRERYLMVS